MKYLYLFIAAITIFSCSESTKQETITEEQTTEKTVTLKLYEAEVNNEYADAELKLNQSKKTEEDLTYNFEYAVSNYELMQQTEGAEMRHCANSGKGQHIHFILNNKAYKAKYEPNFSETLDEGENVILSFLSRSYHESIKNGKAHTIEIINANEENSFDVNGSHLFYSRPKGTYKGEDGKKILVDFFLLNTKLSKTGNKVILTVDGTDMTIAKWAPFFLEGLQPGEHTFRIKLVDKDGKLIPGRFNDSGDRKITIEA